MTRLVGVAVLAGLIVALVAACGEPAPAHPTVVPGDRTATAEARRATASADAEAALARRPPCVFDPATRDAMQAIADVLWEAGNVAGEAAPPVGCASTRPPSPTGC